MSAHPFTHSLEYFNYHNGTLITEQVPIRNVVDKIGTPVYIYSTDAILHPLKALQKGLEGLDYLVCFAVKANSNVAVLKLLADAGAGMDVVSGGELYRATQANVSADRIVFSGVGKTVDEIKMALEMNQKGIYSFNVESVAELELLNQVAIQMNRKASIALRFNPDVDAKTHPYISTGFEKNKFGIDKTEILRIVHRLGFLEGIDLKGISIHIGSQLLSLSPLEDSFIRLRGLIEEISPLLKTPLQFIDLGGGIGISYKNENPPTIHEYCALVHEVFAHYASLTNSSGKNPKLKILIEPGRVICGNAGILVTQILFRKEKSKKDFLIVDAAMTDLIRPALYQSYHEIIPIEEEKLKGESQSTTIVGPVCESSDLLGDDRHLSKNLVRSDLLAVLSAGAYGFSMSSQYNSRPRSAEVLVQNDQWVVIRKRETYSDLIQGEVYETHSR